MSPRRSTLSEYGTKEYPGFEQLKNGAGPVPDSVAKGVTNKLERFQTAVQINDTSESYLVGGIESPRSTANYSRLYHHPTGHKSGLAGVLRWGREITKQGEPDKYTVGFSPNSAATIKEVRSLSITQHARSKRLSKLLPGVRSALTGLDWTDGDPRPAVDDWYTAANRLSEFANSRERAYSFPPAAINRNKPTFVLARWDSSAIDSLIHVEQSLLESDTGVTKATPESFRELLFDYADTNNISPM